MLYCILAAGTVFGYAALKPILIEERVYRELCTQQELDKNVHVCVEQEIRLNLVFTLAVVGTNVSALPVGAILDKYGPRICGFISSAFLTIGALLLAYSAELRFDSYLIGYFFLAIGGCFLYVPSLHLGNSIPNHSGLVMALIAGSFDSSSVVFLAYQKLYFGNSVVFGLKQLFMAYLIVPIFIFWVQATIMPKESYKVTRELVKQADENRTSINQATETTALLREEYLEQDVSIATQNVDDIASKLTPVKDMQRGNGNETFGECGAIHEKTLQSQICSPWFLLITLFTIIQMIRINYFIATIRPQYEYILGSYEEAIKINSIFDTTLPLGGLIAVPLVGMILDNLSIFSIYSLLLVTTTMIGVLGCLPFKWSAYLNVFAFVLYRPFYYTAVSDFVAKIFGFRTFGTVYGLLISFAGVFNLTANGLDKLRYNIFKKNPIPINLFLLTFALLIGTGLVIYAKSKSNEMNRRNLESAEENFENALVE